MVPHVRPDSAKPRLSRRRAGRCKLVSWAGRLGHKDMRLATELGRELGVPMRLANMAFAEMTEALNRGWENRDSRSPALSSRNGVGSRSKLILGGFKNFSTAIHCTLVV